MRSLRTHIAWKGMTCKFSWLRHEYRHFAQNPLLAAAVPLVEHIEVTVCVSQMGHCYIVKYHAIIRKLCFRLLEHIFVPKYPKLEFYFFFEFQW